MGIRILRGSHGYTTTRIIAAGSVVAEPCVVWWIALHPKESDWELGFSDGTATGTTNFTIGYGSTSFFELDPPYYCATGLYCEKLDHINSATICYSTV